jgi:hypothetical protein
MFQINDSNYVSRSDYSHMVREPKVPQAAVKIPRTYGWLCPIDHYKSDKHYNTQRHISLRHGYGSCEPIDSSTGLTRDQKRRNALGQDTSSINIHGNNYNTNSSSRPFDNAQLRYDSGSNQSYFSNQNAFHMPLLDDATRVRELGYCQNVPAGIQTINKTPYGAACVTGRAQPYRVPPDFQPRKGMIPANLPHPNPNPHPHPHPYNPLAVQQSYYPHSNDLRQSIPNVPQNALVRMKLDLYYLFKDP